MNSILTKPAKTLIFRKRLFPELKGLISFYYKFAKLKSNNIKHRLKLPFGLIIVLVVILAIALLHDLIIIIVIDAFVMWLLIVEFLANKFIQIHIFYF